MVSNDGGQAQPKVGGTPAPRSGERRLALAVGAVATIIAGLTIATVFSGFAADATADGLYAALVYLLVGVVFPRLYAIVTAVVAFSVSAIIEFSQLTGLPAALAGVFPPARLVFGTTFVATDLIFYALGAALIAAGDVLVTRLVRRLRDRSGDTSRRP
ncbi:DUF2809 domain-containing protein [Mycetocola zhujimingii]|nr:DUF2809 domain-containing protein [Mycetocola zhujimingii]